MSLVSTVLKTIAFRQLLKPVQKFLQKVMIWLGACAKGISSAVTLDEGAVDHAGYTNEALPVAQKYGNKVFGNDWVY